MFSSPETKNLEEGRNRKRSRAAMDIGDVEQVCHVAGALQGFRGLVRLPVVFGPSVGYFLQEEALEDVIEGVEVLVRDEVEGTAARSSRFAHEKNHVLDELLGAGLGDFRSGDRSVGICLCTRLGGLLEVR